MLKKVVISVIVVFLVIFVLVRVSSTIKEYTALFSDMSAMHEKIVKVVDRLNVHIERMDPATIKERAKSFERLAKNLQPFIKPFFESGMDKKKEDFQTEQ